MPAISKNQQQAAGIALAAKKRDIAKKVSEGAERVANMFGRSLIEGGHKAGCTCGFCKNKGSFGKKKKEEPTKELDKPTEPEEVKEAFGSVKLSKGVNLGGPAAKTYNKMTSKQAMTPGWKPKAYIKAAGEISGNTKNGQMQGFKNKAAGETTTGKKLPKTRAGESCPSTMARQLVSVLLD